MKIFVKAKTKKKETHVEKIDAIHLEVSVKEAPIDGKANAAIILALAEYFDVSASQVQLINGHTSKQKVFEVL